MAGNSKSIRQTRMPRKKSNARKKTYHPKWHDISCEEAHRKVSVSARLVKSNPKDQSLGSRLRQDIKDYNKLIKLWNKQFVDNMFVELDSMENSNPRGYMDLIRAMRDSSFDKSTSDDTSGVKPSEWHAHFSRLLSKKVNIDKNLE